MKLSDYAKQMGVRYETAWRWFRDGKIQGRRIGRHTISSTEGQEDPVRAPSQRVAVDARASSTENKSNLDSQAARLIAYCTARLLHSSPTAQLAYCTARGYQVAKVAKVAKVAGSGVNDARPKLLALLEDQGIGLIVVEHKDRLTRFGFRYLDTLLKGQSRAIEVVNQAENGTEDWLADLLVPLNGHFVLVLRPALRAATRQAQDRSDCTGVRGKGRERTRGEADATG